MESTHTHRYYKCSLGKDSIHNYHSENAQYHVFSTDKRVAKLVNNAYVYSIQGPIIRTLNKI